MVVFIQIVGVPVSRQGVPLKLGIGVSDLRRSGKFTTQYYTPNLPAAPNGKASVLRVSVDAIELDRRARNRQEIDQFGILCLDAHIGKFPAFASSLRRLPQRLSHNYRRRRRLRTCRRSRASESINTQLEGGVLRFQRFDAVQ